jgi:hypothetical protein
MSEEQLAAAYSLAELKEMCSQLGVPVSGTKPALAGRISQAYKAQAAAGGSSSKAAPAAAAEDGEEEWEEGEEEDAADAAFS